MDVSGQIFHNFLVNRNMKITKSDKGPERFCKALDDIRLSFSSENASVCPPCGARSEGHTLGVGRSSAGRGLHSDLSLIQSRAGGPQGLWSPVMCRAQSQNRTQVTPSRGRQRVVSIMSTLFPLNRKNMIQMVSPKGVECRLQFNIIACPGGLRFPNGMRSLEDSQQINRLTRENYKNNYSLRKLS